MTGKREIDLEIIGHGGAAGFFPGNSRESLEKAIELGVDRIEIDVRVTADQTLVLVHDEELHDDPDKTRITSLAYADLRERRADIISLDEAIELTKPAIPLLIDVKGRRYEQELIQTIRSHGIEETCAVSSTHARSLRMLRNALPRMRIGLSRGHSLTKIRNARIRGASAHVISAGQVPSLVTLAKWCGATEVMLQHHLCTRNLVRVIRRRGLGVYPWTVDEPSEMRRLIELDVDGIISNRPDLVRSTAEEFDEP